MRKTVNYILQTSNTYSIIQRSSIMHVKGENTQKQGASRNAGFHPPEKTIHDYQGGVRTHRSLFRRYYVSGGR
jgi:hypothetical protein